jgi:hypothetical protein
VTSFGSRRSRKTAPSAIVFDLSFSRGEPSHAGIVSSASRTAPSLRSTFSASCAKANAWLAHLRLKYGSVSSVAICLALREFLRNSAGVDLGMVPPTI